MKYQSKHQNIRSRKCVKNVYALFCSGSTIISKKCGWMNYCDVTWGSCHLRLMAIQLFIQQLLQSHYKKKFKVQHNWPFVRGIHQSPVDSSHKGPVMLNAFPCFDIVMKIVVKHVFVHINSLCLSTLSPCKTSWIINVCLLQNCKLTPMALLRRF